MKIETTKMQLVSNIPISKMVKFISFGLVQAWAKTRVAQLKFVHLSVMNFTKHIEYVTNQRRFLAICSHFLELLDKKSVKEFKQCACIADAPLDYLAALP